MPRRSDWRLCAGSLAASSRVPIDVRPEGGARCVSSARRDLCGGREAILVPTATLLGIAGDDPAFRRREHPLMSTTSTSGATDATEGRNEKMATNAGFP